MRSFAIAVLALSAFGLDGRQPPPSAVVTRPAVSQPQADSSAVDRPAVTRRLKCPEPAPQWADVDRTTPPGTRYETFPSRVARTAVSYLLYLPPGYGAGAPQRYPVVYWLHGMCGHAWNGDAFVAQLDRAIRGRQAPAMIAVLVNGMGDSYYFDSPDGRWPIESVIVRDLIPHIDHTYRTIARREARVVEGFSMGGFGAAHLAFKFTDIFGVAVIDAGAFNSLDTFRQGIPEIAAKMLGDTAYFDANDPMRLVTHNADALRSRLAIRLAVGDQDNLEAPAHDLHMLLRKLGIPHEFEVIPGVAHDRQRFYDTLGVRAFAFVAARLGGE